MSALPLSWALAFGRAIGWVWYWLAPVRLGVARRNVRRVYGATLDARAQRRLVRDCVGNLCMYAIESLRLPSLTLERARELTTCEGWEHLERAYARGQGVIIVSPHMDSWDLLCCAVAIRGMPVSVVFKEIHWRAASDFFFAVRRASGVGVIAPRRSKDEIRALLAEKKIVAFAIDQHMARHRGIVCELFGQLASTTPAPARFAFESGAPIIPVRIERTADPCRHIIKIEPPFGLESPYAGLEANIRHNTERLNRVVERWIRATPSQWLWLHRRWKVQDDPAGWDVPAELASKVGSSVGG